MPKLTRDDLIKLFLIFVLAIILRFLFFPNDIYFAYDQARDAFISRNILKGDFKIVGPPSSFGPSFNHGVLFYYLAGPIYEIAQGNPEGISIFLRLYNALGIFLVFLIGWNLFNKKTGLISAFLFAISFEQTQYAIFLAHPTMASLTTLAFYLGFILLIFKHLKWGLILSMAAFGLSLQFHVSLLFLAPIIPIFLVSFRKNIPTINFQTWILSILALAITTFTFILAEFKYGFKLTKGIFSPEIKHLSVVPDWGEKLNNLVFILNRFLSDNLINIPIPIIGLVLVILAFFWIVRLKKYRLEGIFLLIWLSWGLLAYFLVSSKIYYYSIGTSVSLIILASFIINQLLEKSRFIGILCLGVILISNLFLVGTYNPKGSIDAFTSQGGMMLMDEKQVIDLTYKIANSKPFAINALTVPYGVDTTWSYLYEWYGQKKYGYLPIWGGESALGYFGNLQIHPARSTLPDTRFLIIEPTQGLQKVTIDKFLETENIFASTVNIYKLGKFTVWEQKPKAH